MYAIISSLGRRRIGRPKDGHRRVHQPYQQRIPASRERENPSLLCHLQLPPPKNRTLIRILAQNPNPRQPLEKMEPVALAKASTGGGGGNLVLILDYGSQYTHLITRRIRQLSVFSLCISGTSSLSSIAELRPRVVILSGGPHSVHVDGAPSFPDGFLRYAEENGVYVLGICYGMQLMVQKLGGEVVVGEKQEYGKMEISVVEEECGLYGPEAVCGTQTVWMSHGDEVVKLPEGFTVVARSLQGSVAAIENHFRRFYGLQYHPEVI